MNDTQTKKKALEELLEIRDTLEQLSCRARMVMKSAFPEHLGRAEAYGALHFGFSTNRYSTTFSSIVEALEDEHGEQG